MKKENPSTTNVVHVNQLCVLQYDFCTDWNLNNNNNQLASNAVPEHGRQASTI